ncbi:hypothetical protein [Sideroxydans lithotrophicus]|uniref:Phage protein n=1 Tax=Sideroxydans lithotrophicus (strain ES-1) TaxID=580332 RepID=D5CT49_SIDLE|nr:hypothetical protein [Sideroxydans lithotrophicus]ADE12135.1 conserved hypothetical protein [Sideroxydans lithotrophicus ES-1]
MANLTLNKPSDAMKATAAAEHTVEDAKGRKIKLKKPHFLAQFNMVKMLGNVPSAYISMVSPLLFVAAIDDDAVTTPTTPREVDALLTRLDAHGYAAIMTGIDEKFGENSEDEKKAEADLKKS